MMIGAKQIGDRSLVLARKVKFGLTFRPNGSRDFHKNFTEAVSVWGSMDKIQVLLEHLFGVIEFKFAHEFQGVISPLIC